MSTEGDRRSRILEDHTEQHFGVLDTQTSTAETREMSGVSDIQVDTITPLKERVFHLVVVCVELMLICLVFIFVIYAFLRFVQSLSISAALPCPVNSTFPLNQDEFLRNFTVER